MICTAHTTRSLLCHLEDQSSAVQCIPGPVPYSVIGSIAPHAALFSCTGRHLLRQLVQV